MIGGSMNYILLNIIYFFVVFIFVWLLQYNFFIKPKPKRGKNGKIVKEKKVVLEIEYLSKKFNIDKKLLMNCEVGNKICLLNSFIISTVCLVISLLDFNYVFQLLMGFVLLMGLIYSLYEVWGRRLSKRFGDGKKDEL